MITVKYFGPITYCELWISFVFSIVNYCVLMWFMNFICLLSFVFCLGSWFLVLGSYLCSFVFCLLSRLFCLDSWLLAFSSFAYRVYPRFRLDWVIVCDIMFYFSKVELNIVIKFRVVRKITIWYELWRTFVIIEPWSV